MTLDRLGLPQDVVEWLLSQPGSVDESWYRRQHAALERDVMLREALRRMVHEAEVEAPGRVAV